MADTIPKNGGGAKIPIIVSAAVIGFVVVGLSGFMLAHTQAPAHATAAVKMIAYEKGIDEVKGNVKDIDQKVDNIQRSVDRIEVLIANP